MRIDELSTIVSDWPDKIEKLQALEKELVDTEKELNASVTEQVDRLSSVTDNLCDDLLEEINGEKDSMKTDANLDELETLATKLINETQDMTNAVNALMDADKYGIFSKNREGQTGFERAEEHKLKDIVCYMMKLNPKKKFVKNNQFKRKKSKKKKSSK